MVSTHHCTRRPYTADGARYEGEWVAGLRSGQGSQRSDDGGVVYEGGWLDDLRHGQGELREKASLGAPERTYNGQWVCGIRHGRGKATMATGEGPRAPRANGSDVPFSAIRPISRVGKGVVNLLTYLLDIRVYAPPRDSYMRSQCVVLVGLSPL